MPLQPFKLFMNEAPIPQDSTDLIRHVKGKNIFKQITTILKTLAPSGPLGAGSARVAIRFDVPESLFSPETKKYFDKPNTQGNYETVAKFAINSKGIVQNTEELTLWNKTRSKWLCPIVDTSLEILRLKAKESKEPWTHGILFVQMPMADTSDKALKSGFKKIFGLEVDKVISEVEWFISADNKDTVKKQMDAVEELYHPSKEQLDNLVSFATFVKESTLTDLRIDNFGIYRGNVVLIDYGYSSITYFKSLYTHKTLIKQDEDGNIFFRQTPDKTTK